MKSLYEAITERIVEDLKRGVVPWRKPWCSSENGQIVSHATGHGYSLLNSMLLDRPGEYLTFNQAVKEGGHVKKGAKSRQVFFFKQYPVKIGYTDDDGEKAEITATVPLLRQFRIFHIDDCEGIAPKYEARWKGGIPIRENGSDEEAERVAAEYVAREGIDVIHDGDRACYSPATDSVRIPKAGNFAGDAHYYSALFHELTHSTGAPKRLNRDLGGSFGSSDYAREELVAEIGSAFICGRLGLDTKGSRKNETAYIASWLEFLAKDPKAIVWAANRAEKAAKFIFGEKLNYENADDAKETK